MGASTFEVIAKGATAKEAFENAASQDRYENGHSYSGGIGMKHSFKLIALPAGKVASDYANELINNGDPRIDDKYGPAGCIALGGNRYLFFGWASS